MILHSALKIVILSNRSNFSDRDYSIYRIQQSFESFTIEQNIQSYFNCGTMLLFIALVGAASYFFYKWLTGNRKYFEDRDVPYLKPSFAMGETWKMMTAKATMPDTLLKYYNMFPNSR